MTTTTMSEAAMGIGWSNGMASQVSLPIISLHRLLDRRLEQLRGDVAERLRLVGPAWAREPPVGNRIELAARRLGRGDPALELRRRHRLDLEAHVGEPSAAVVRTQPLEDAGIIGQELEAVDHAGHGIDLAAKLGH